MKVAVIGCGVMGSAFARHFAKKHSVLLHDRDKDKARSLANEIGATVESDLGKCVERADAVLLAIKPKDLKAAAKGAAKFLTEKKILISILAGTPLAALKKNFPSGVLVRSMPNLALVYGQGVVGLAENSHIAPQAKKSVDALLEGIGLVAWMSEDKIEALTALSGSGIGFVLVMIEAMIDGGVHLGFTVSEAREFAMKTMEGAVALMRESGKHPAELKLNIASPGGTTIAGLKVLEEEGVRAGIVEAMVACHEKALSMIKD
jgi:pyrroline-5-carboxylate reductase